MSRCWKEMLTGILQELLDWKVVLGTKNLRLWLDQGEINS
jgi:hypothetical protein